MSENYTLEERLAYALYTQERVRPVMSSLDKYNDALEEVRTNFRRLICSGEVKNFLDTLDKCGLKLSLAGER